MMPDDSQIDPPQTLAGLFPPCDDEDDHEECDAEEQTPSLCFEVQTMVIAGRELRVRQFDYHSHNANRVWPGTFNLADYLMETNADSGMYLRNWGNILELGTATGLLAIRLALSSPYHSEPAIVQNPTSPTYCCDSVFTSDVQDEHNDIADNLHVNYELNSIYRPPIHIPHTWGTGWRTAVESAGVPMFRIDTIVASDILLYVAHYKALVQTLTEIMSACSCTTFVMSWNRRMKDSEQFFSMMQAAGFQYQHEGKCIYTFKSATY